jgi:hypothetical protein
MLNSEVLTMPHVEYVPTYWFYSAAATLRVNEAECLAL